MRKTKISDLVERFVNKHLNIKKKILLAVSGGPDSMVLLESFSKIPDLQLGVAHVDHRWRPTSAEEALMLKHYVEELKIPFYIKTLSPQTLNGNLEDACRQVRYHFFKKICDDHGYQGVVTGHHADDQVETVLKRFFEGSALVRLSGIQYQKQIFGVNVFRPFLEVSKLSIQEEAKKLKFTPIQDSTNVDPRYARGRMRSYILPILENKFGKKIKKGVLEIAEEARDIEAYLDGQTDRYMSSIIRGAMGLYVDLSAAQSRPTLELKHFIRRFCSLVGACLSRDQLRTLFDLVTAGAANKKIILRDGVIHIDRSRIFFTEESEVKYPKKKELVLGKQIYGDWIVEVSECFQKFELEKFSWLDVWKGELLVYLPKNNYYIGPYEKNKSLDKRFTNDKVPCFLREKAPLLWKSERVCREFLSGRKSEEQSPGGLCISLRKNV